MRACSRAPPFVLKVRSLAAHLSPDYAIREVSYSALEAVRLHLERDNVRWMFGVFNGFFRSFCAAEIEAQTCLAFWP